MLIIIHIFSLFWCYFLVSLRPEVVVPLIVKFIHNDFTFWKKYMILSKRLTHSESNLKMQCNKLLRKVHWSAYISSAYTLYTLLKSRYSQPPTLNNRKFEFYIWWYCWIIVILGPLQKQSELGCMFKSFNSCTELYRLKSIQLGRNDSVIAQRYEFDFTLLFQKCQMFIVLSQVLFVHLLGIECFILLEFLFLCWISLDPRKLGLANRHVLFRVFLNFSLTFPSSVDRCFLYYFTLSRFKASTFISLCHCVCHSFRCLTITTETWQRYKSFARYLTKLRVTSEIRMKWKLFHVSSDTKCWKWFRFHSQIQKKMTEKNIFQSIQKLIVSVKCVTKLIWVLCFVHCDACK